MSFKQINKLRQSGQLDEALTLANKALDADPDNLWNLRAMAWVQYDLIKKNISTQKHQEALKHLEILNELKLSEDEGMIFENVLRQVIKLGFALQTRMPDSQKQLSQLFSYIKNWPHQKPSLSYSLLYKAFHKNHLQWDDFLDFADWWNFDHFIKEDYQPAEYKGKTTLSLAEQAYNAYAKTLAQQLMANMHSQPLIDRANHYIKRLEHIEIHYPQFQYTTYQKSKLLILLDRKEEARKSFLPFARKKQNAFWVWQMLAELNEENSSLQLACLCKALQIKSPPEYLIKTREQLATTLIQSGEFRRAKTEILMIIQTRISNNWKIPQQIAAWENSEWFKTTQAYSNNQDFYRNNAQPAEHLLFSDLPETAIIITHVNPDKGVAGFMASKTHSGFFTYKKHLKAIHTGQVLMVRFSEVKKEGFHHLIGAKPAPEGTRCEAAKKFKGTLKTINNFGLAGPAFIPPHLISQEKLQAGEQIQGIAIASFDKKKNQWGWKAILASKAKAG